MSRLQSVIKEKNDTINHRKEFSDFHKIKKKRENTKKIIKGTVIGTLIVLIIGFIYLPQFFLKKDESEDIIITPNLSIFSEYNIALKNGSEEDWDNDGVINSIEEQKGLNIWNADSDGDGFTDYYELSVNGKANEKDQSLTEKMKTILKDKDEKYDMAYKVNDVILWADDIRSRTYGSVIRTPNGGYQFTNFKGYAQFPEEGVAYKIKNGKHVKMKYRKKGNAYYINGDALVYIYDSRPVMVNKVTFFNKEFYTSDNFVMRFISFILPDKGFIASSRMASTDADNTFAGSTTVSGISKVSYSNDINRFSANTNSLEDMLTYRTLIQKNIAVPVSLFDDDKGEYLGVAYGYTKNGDIIIADYYSKEFVGTLKVSYTAETLYDGNNIFQKEYFNYKGLGFNSEDGSRIRFLNENFE